MFNHIHWHCWSIFSWRNRQVYTNNRQDKDHKYYLQLLIDIALSAR